MSDFCCCGRFALARRVFDGRGGTVKIPARGQAGFAAKVSSLGGNVRTSHAGAGFAVVSGLTNSGAAQLAAMTGVAEVDPDAVVGLDLPNVRVRSGAADFGSSSEFLSARMPSASIAR